MANSTSNIDLIAQAQASKEVTANAALDAASPSMTYGRRQSACSGLTFGYYGGNVTLSSGTMSQIANGTLTLTASATNYIVANKATGAVSFSTATTNWNDSANYWRLYSVVVGAATVTSYIDSRELAKYTGGGGGGGTWGGITGTLSDQTDLQSAINLKANAASPNTSGTLTHSGDIILSGSGKRITGDLSNATVANRLMFQSSTVNGETGVGVVPNGTSTTAGVTAYNAANPTNASTTTLQTTSTQSKLIAGKTGTGTYKPLALNVGGADVVTYSEAAATLGDMTASVSRDSSLRYIISNTNAGFNASIAMEFITDAGALVLRKVSTAGLRYGVLTSTGGEFHIGTLDNHALRIIHNNASQLTLTGGNTLHSVATGGLGYGPGAGSIVTQTTDKATTIPAFNYPTGLIITSDSALAGNTAVAFIVINSRVSLTDTVSCNVVGGTGDVNAYVATAFPNNGRFFISLRNMTAGSLSNAIEIKFNVFKGSNT